MEGVRNKIAGLKSRAHRRAARLRADSGAGRAQCAARDELLRRPERAADGGALRRRRALFPPRTSPPWWRWDFAKALELSVPADHAALKRWYENRFQPS